MDCRWNDDEKKWCASPPPSLHTTSRSDANQYFNESRANVGKYTIVKASKSISKTIVAVKLNLFFSLLRQIPFRFFVKSNNSSIARVGNCTVKNNIVWFSFCRIVPEVTRRGKQNVVGYVIGRIHSSQSFISRERAFHWLCFNGKLTWNSYPFWTTKLYMYKH